ELTHLCAHTLLNRPMIFSGNDVITVSFSGYEGSSVSASVDGDSGIMLNEGDEIIIKKSDTYLNLIDISGGSFYNSVSNKLMQPLK
ncbi:MAG: NAD(+)/NADH kinase, partial [Ruminiclostridium sp.]|nr:NAD(+)/NADH kinase [Ruminiclostridium sp.]